MRATNKHYGSESKSIKKATTKKHKKVKALSFVFAVAVAAVALIVPTTTLAPDVDAFEDSRAVSYSVGDVDEFSVEIASNCIQGTTVPTTQEVTTVAPTTEETTSVKATEAAKKVKAEVKKTEPVTEVEKLEKPEATTTVVEKVEETKPQNKVEATTSPVVKNEGYLIGISNPDTSYSPKAVALSKEDRAKLERLVMGEAGSMGFNGCALVAQCIRDAMNRSNTTSIDRIISEYKYYAPTNKEPNKSVKDAVSYIFDQNGSAVQHRIICFYTGTSGWHETQNFIVGCGNVRFFDLKY